MEKRARIVERNEPDFAIHSMDDQRFMNDQRFFDLAMKVSAHRCTDAERAELESLLASQPELRARLEQLQTDASLARDVLPLLEATKSSAPEFPAYARDRLLTAVRQTLGEPQSIKAKPAWNWQWALGLATVAAALALLLLLPSLNHPAAPVIQVALLDTTGAMRGSETSEIEVLKQQWKNSTIETFDKTDPLESWKTKWPDGDQPGAKVIYDRPSGEVHVFLRIRGRSQEKTFVIESDLASTLREADTFIREQMKR